MKIHFFGYSLDFMGSLQKYNAGLTAFDTNKKVSYFRHFFSSESSEADVDAVEKPFI